MAYSIKYYYTFKNPLNDVFKVEILDQSSTGSTEITGGDQPFTISYIDSDNIFNPVRSSGANFSIISAENMQFVDLYSADMFSYQIRFYKNDSLIWMGYLDSEMYNENFSYLTNYQVNLTANDGFNLLNRIKFLDENGNKYTGLLTLKVLIEKCLLSLNLPFDYLYVSMSTTYEGQLPNSYALQSLKVTADNYYNEDGEAETLRTVLESILTAFNLSIIQKNGSYFLYDHNKLLDENRTWRKYKNEIYANELLYQGTGTTANFLGDLSGITFTSDNQQYEYIANFNSVKTVYNSYQISNIHSFTPSKNDNYSLLTTTQKGTSFWVYNTFLGIWQYLSLPTSDYATKYKYLEYKYLYITPELENKYLYQSKGNGSENTDQNEYYLKIENDTNYNFTGITNTLYSFDYQPYIYSNFSALSGNTNQLYYLKIQVKAQFKGKEGLNNPDESAIDSIRKAKLYIKVMADQYRYANLGGWFISDGDPSLDNDKNNYFHLTYYKSNLSSSITDEYLYNVGNGKQSDYQLIPLNSYLRGKLTVQISECVDFYNSSNALINLTAPNIINEVKINEIKVTITDSLGNEISANDKEKIGYLDQRYASEGNTINFIIGSNTTNYPIQHGTIYDDNYTVQNFTRKNLTGDLQDLLINSYLSNYSTKSVQLTADIKPVQGIGYITYNNYLPSKKFIIQSETIDYHNNTSNVKLIEYKQDQLEFD